jgi:2-keto-4-pentenoate hydratase/2-oxohepta-3-ene-1,7-dioic acid hydratase in catechol pathway
MKLVTFLHENLEQIGALAADESAVHVLPYLDMEEVIRTPREELDAAVQAAEILPLSEVTLLAPIPRPRQDVICLGINYHAHAEEAARYSAESFTKERPIPIYFSKRVTEAVAPNGFIESHPGLVERLDYEAELAIIIGKTAKNVKAEDAGDYIFGYTVLNDVSARVLQTTHKQWYFGKSLDGFTPIGPCITTADEIAASDIVDNPKITYTWRQFDGFTVDYYVNSHNSEQKATFKRGSYAIDIATGDKIEFCGEYTFPPYGSLVVVDDGTPCAPKKAEKELKALDIPASAFCMENDIKCYAFALSDPDNIYRVIMGEKMGTELHR